MPHSNYLPERMGSATVEVSGHPGSGAAVEAGSYQSFELRYRAGFFGIDDTGSIKVVYRFASDMGRPQFSDPAGANYVSVEASNGAVLHVEYDMKRNIRPWDKTLYIKVVRGFLREGDEIVIRLGDRRGGGPGMRVQTFCEHTFEFRVLVDAFATYDYVEIVDQPTIAIVAGPPVVWKAILPTERIVGQPFRLCLKAEDRWGNPSDLASARFALEAKTTVAGLPETVSFTEGEPAVIVDGLTVDKPGDLVISVLDEGKPVAVSNPLRLVESADLLPYWGDLHGQSEETIGTNSARDFHTFARDLAFLDAVSHQGNDFQITSEFWGHLNELTAEFDEPGRFVAFPGYEWSGNTGLGGDRNVLFANEGRPIHRSSHALVGELDDGDTDAHSAGALFDAISGEDCVVFAHIGGRYADIIQAHDVRLERSVEIHSAWGTFEWLLEDAFRQGYRVGIVANSDGHKGRPGASHPGATKFGAYGGLTCLLAPSFDRAGFLEALRRRHHYATTGCRMILDTRAVFAQPARLFYDDPRFGGTTSQETSEAMMGDIVESAEHTVTFRADVVGAAPIERVEIRNGQELIETFRPFGTEQLGRRIRVLWEGSEYRGRGRETTWDGRATVTGNGFEKVEAINAHNLDKRFELIDNQRLEWEALTTGGFGGFDAWLRAPADGTLRLDTPLVQAELAIETIGLRDKVFDAGGIGRRIRVFRLPDGAPSRAVAIERTIEIVHDRDNALYVSVVQEDGGQAWSSPIYILSSPQE